MFKNIYFWFLIGNKIIIFHFCNVTGKINCKFCSCYFKLMWSFCQCYCKTILKEHFSLNEKKIQKSASFPKLSPGGQEVSLSCWVSTRQWGSEFRYLQLFAKVSSMLQINESNQWIKSIPKKCLTRRWAVDIASFF